MKPIADIYEKYKHLDAILSKPVSSPSFKGDILRECWAAITAAAGVCHWVREDEEADSYRTDCGHLWEFTTGGPTENGARFCLYCGRAVQ